MAAEGTVLWRPSEAFVGETRLAGFMAWLAEHRGVHCDDYQALWQWSVDSLDDFWQAVWDYFQVESTSPHSAVLATRDMPGARWFAGARVNYARHVLSQGRGRGDETALYHQSEIRPLERMSWDDLTAQVLTLAGRLRDLGVGPGDRVVAYMPNIPETVVACLAAASIGAIWSSCSPDFGTQSVLDRFAQIEPKVVFAVDGYRYGGKDFDRRDVVATLMRDLPSVERLVFLPYLNPREPAAPVDGALAFADLVGGAAPSLEDFDFADVAFDHPLWVLYSSGTTGLPKGIVHSHGGIVVEHLKHHAFHLNLGPNSRFFWFTTTGWTMWNVLLGGLVVGASIVLYDGNPAYPDTGVLWRLAEDVGITCLGTSAAFITALAAEGATPGRDHDLSALQCLGSTGSPLSPEAFDWVYKQVKPEVWLASISGGTDICTAFVGSVPILPVRSGVIQARCLGVHAEVFDDDGHPLIDQVGELVVLKPMPSMPVKFWNDRDGARYRESYFDVFPGVWRHGDFMRLLPDGGCIIHGRSDSTLNRYGIRIGTAEIYRAVEDLDEVEDSLIVNLDLPKGRFFMPLFVVLKTGVVLDDALKKRIAARIRADFSPRHVPDAIIAVDDIPYTLTGKKMEVPVRRILTGTPVEKAANRDAMRNPDAVDFFVRYARETDDYSLAS